MQTDNQTNNKETATTYIPDTLIRRSIKIAFILVALLGFLDAGYLTANHYLNIVPPCFVVQGCDTVTTSVYSKILGIPVSLLGALYYLSVFIGMLYYADTRKRAVLKPIFFLTCIGFLFSLWFLYAQIFLIGALCTYCLVSAVTSTTLFGLGVHIWKQTKNHP